jgi:hypothetical protein
MTHRALTVEQAIALAMLRDGFRRTSITAWTGVPDQDLRRLARAYNITAGSGGHPADQAKLWHQDRNDEAPCVTCAVAQAERRADERRAEALAAAKAQFGHRAVISPRRRRAAAPAGSLRKSANRAAS